MTGDRKAFTDKVDYKGSIFLHVQEMSREAARDGYLREYEDMVDSLVDYLFPYIEGTDLEAVLEEIEKDGEDLDEITDKKEWEKAKRRRIREKTRLCFKRMNQLKLLLAYVPEYSSELTEDLVPVRRPK